MKRVTLVTLVLGGLLSGCGGQDDSTNWDAERVNLSRSQAAFQVQDDETRERMVDAVVAGRRAAAESDEIPAQKRAGKAFADAYVDDAERDENYYSPLVAAQTVEDWMRGAPTATCRSAAAEILARFDPSGKVQDPSDPAYDRQRAQAPAAMQRACRQSPGDGSLPEARGPGI